MPINNLNTILYSGGCHCGAVKFEVRAPEYLSLIECNCSICHTSGFLHLHVNKNDFKMLSGGEQLTTYRFNTMQAQHTFCKICGIKPFYRPRSHPEDYSVNVRCLNVNPDKIFNIAQFNGQNWEQNIDQFPDQPVGKPTIQDK